MYVSKSIGSIQTNGDLNLTNTCQCNKCAVETLYIGFDYSKTLYTFLAKKGCYTPGWCVFFVIISISSVREV